MKKIQDYLHLYNGCEVETPDGLRKMWCYNPLFDLIYVETKPPDISPSRAYFTYHVAAIKPILRPLSSMTEEECVNVYTIERDRMLHSPTDDHDIRRGDGCWKIVRLDFIDTTLFITDEAVVYKVTEDNGKPLIEYIKNLPEIFTYLLSHHFDLFNLIPENLAIDSTTLTHQSP